MLEVVGVRGVAVIRDGGAGEVEGAAVAGGDNFDGIWVGDVFRAAVDFEGGGVNVILSEGHEQSVDVVWAQEGLVALDVDVDVEAAVGGVLGDGVKAVGAAGQAGVGEQAGDIVLCAERRNLGGVGGDDDVVKPGAGLRRTVDPKQEGFAEDGAQDLAGQARGTQARGDDAEDSGFGGGGH